jgi:uncharacterized protein YndB with AHSA1/START domain
MELNIDIAAKPETVFRFLSDPELFKQWMGPGAILSATAVAVHYPNGGAARGTLKESVPNQRIVFGWGYEDGAHGLQPDATTVTIELTPTATGTRVTLRHDGIDEVQAAEHKKGWLHYLGQLKAGASNIGHAEALANAVNGYIQAWNETDFAKRETILAECWDEAGIFRDAMGSADGRVQLNYYIGGAQQFAPGFKLELDGAPEQCHGYYRFSWAIRMPDGNVMARGTNFGQLNANGQIASAIGFWNK